MEKLKIAHITFEYGEAIIGGLGAFLNEIVHYQSLSIGIEPIVVIPFSYWKIGEMELLHSDNQFQLFCSNYNGVKLYQIASPHFDQTIYPMNQIEFMKKVNFFGVFLGQCIKNIACDIFHFHDFFGVKSLFSLYNNKIPSLCTLHSLHHWDHYAISSEYLMINNVDIVVPVGKSFFEENKSIFKISIHKINIIPNGIDLNHWIGDDYNIDLSLKEKLDKFCHDRPNNIIFGFVGRINERQKGFNQILANLSKFQDNRKMLIVGAGDSELVESIKHQAELNSNIFFIDHAVNRNSLKYVYACLDYIIIPSNFEPFGLILPEAMAQGVIPITSKVGGLKDNNISYVQFPEEGFGFFIEDHSSHSLYEVIESVSKLSLDCRNLLRKRVLERAKKHSQEICFEKYEVLYRKLLENNEMFG